MVRNTKPGAGSDSAGSGGEEDMDAKQLERWAPAVDMPARGTGQLPSPPPAQYA